MNETATTATGALTSTAVGLARTATLDWPVQLQPTAEPLTQYPAPPSPGVARATQPGQAGAPAFGCAVPACMEAPTPSPAHRLRRRFVPAGLLTTGSCGRSVGAVTRIG